MLNSRQDIKRRDASAKNLFRRASFEIRCEPTVQPKLITSSFHVNTRQLWQTSSRGCYVVSQDIYWFRPYMVNVYIKERINDQKAICAGGHQ